MISWCSLRIYRNSRARGVGNFIQHAGEKSCMCEVHGGAARSSRRNLCVRLWTWFVRHSCRVGSPCGEVKCPVYLCRCSVYVCVCVRACVCRDIHTTRLGPGRGRGPGGYLVSRRYSNKHHHHTYSLSRATAGEWSTICLLYTSPSPRDVEESRMPSSA